jgi:hypothetical protein
MTAHVGGLLGGFASGAALLAGNNALRGTRAIGVALAGVALVIAAVLVIPAPPEGGLPPAIASLLHRFDDIQPKTTASYNELYRQRESHALTDLQFADAVEHEVIPPWQALRKDLQAATGAPPELAPVLDKMVRFMTLREQAWILLVKVLRDPAYSADDERALREKTTAAEQAVRELNEAFKKP